MEEVVLWLLFMDPGLVKEFMFGWNLFSFGIFQVGFSKAIPNPGGPMISLA